MERSISRSSTCHASRSTHEQLVAERISIADGLARKEAALARAAEEAAEDQAAAEERAAHLDDYRVRT